MYLLLALLACGHLAAQTNPLHNLDFATGSLAGWEVEGAFSLTTATRHGPSLTFGVCSSDRGTPGRTALLHRALTVPRGSAALRCTAFVHRGSDDPATPDLDVLLLDESNRVIPKQVRTAEGWQAVGHVLPAPRGRPRDYLWPVAAYAGQKVRLVIVDDDRRPDCFVFCSGFRLVPAGAMEGQEFCRFMVALASAQHLPAMARFDSKHFTALSNADDAFTEMHVRNAEEVYARFYEHFGARGFHLAPPAGKLMIAVFDSQAGFEAYLGRRMPPIVTGMYDRNTNRLVFYDYALNEGFLARKNQAESQARRIGSDLDRVRYIETVQRQAHDFRSGANTATIMHEVAHQLSFNAGLLQRDGDVPLWLAEGLACYCEATRNGSWLGIGELNPERLAALAGPARGQGNFLRLRDLLADDDWLQKSADKQTILLGYAQSWALFRMLLEEQPRAMQNYLKLLAARRTPDHRLTDFGEAFGPDVKGLEARFEAHMRQLVAQHVPQRR